MSGLIDWVVYSLSDEVEEWCMNYTERMLAGPNSPKQQIHESRKEAYRVGRLGEWAVWKWAKDNGVPIHHHPFRESYQQFHSDDDFIFELFGERRQIEVRTKARSVPPQPHYDCCSDEIKPHLLYVFVSYNKSAREMCIVGWADWDVWRRSGIAVTKGKENPNFKHRANEFNIPIGDLNVMRLFTNSDES